LNREDFVIRKALATAVIGAFAGAFALAAAPSVGHAADMPKSYKAATGKKKPAVKSTARAGMPQSKRGPTMQANPPGSRFPYSYRY
jgi:hypothetical protein